MPALVKNIVMLALTIFVGVCCSWTVWAFVTSEASRLWPVLCLCLTYASQIFFACFVLSDAERYMKQMQDIPFAEMRRQAKEYDAISDRIAREAAAGNLETCVDWIEVREKIK
jgi:hypothetical protein